MSATLINQLCLGVFTLSLAAGQLLFKKVGLSLLGVSIREALPLIAREPALYGALVLYGFATLFWIWLLSRVPLAQAYPWVAVGVAVVPFFSWLVFGERMSLSFWIGVGFIMLGIVLTQSAAQGH